MNTWSKSVQDLYELPGVPAAQRNAALLEKVNPEWHSRVEARTSMHDLLFTLPGNTYPFRATVRVSVDGEVYTFTLQRFRDPEPVTSDRAFEANALPVLLAFLEQLVTE